MGSLEASARRATVDERANGVSREEAAAPFPGPNDPAGTAVRPNLRRAFDLVVLERLPIVCVGLVGLFAFLAVAHALVLRPAIAPTMAAAGAIAAGLLLGLWWMLRRGAVQPQWAHPAAAVIAAIVLAQGLLHMYLVPEPEQTTNLMLLILASGSIALSFPWLGAVIAATFLGWIAIAAGRWTSGAWMHFGFALGITTVLSVVICAARMRTVRRVERLRWESDRRRDELAAALRQSERSHDQLEQSQRQLEQTLRQLRESYDRFERFTEVEGVLIHDEGRILETNAVLARMFDCSAAEMVGTQVLTFIAPEFHDRLQQHFQNDSEARYEALALRRNGTRFPVECAAKPVAYDQRIVGAVAIRDISERKRAEQALRRSESLYRGLAEAVPGIVFTTSADGACDYCNPYWYEFTGLTPQETLGYGWIDALHPEDRERLADLWQAALRDRQTFVYETRFRRRDGIYHWFLGHVSPVQGSDGVIIKWVGTCADIDARKRMEEALQEADRLKDEFLALLGHELRNPLAAVRNAHQLLRRPGVPEARAGQAHGIIDRQLAHMTRLINDLLDLSRVTRGQVSLRQETLDLAALARATLEDYRHEFVSRGLDVQTQLTTEPVWVLGDAARLSQVLGNVLHNAAKFTDAGGQIRLWLACTRDTVTIHVRDSGIGIEPRVLPRLFEPFVQGHHGAYGGLGLGLAVAKRLLVAQHGDICATSPGLGHGTEVVMQLPLAPAPAGAAIETRIPERAPKRRVLLIEDDPDVSASMQFLLESLGHEVSTAAYGEQGIELARRVHPHVVLCDIALAGGMDGYAVARALRHEPALSATYLVAVTGYGQDSDEQRAREAGFDMHLTKPVEYAVLQDALSETRADRT